MKYFLIWFHNNVFLFWGFGVTALILLPEETFKGKEKVIIFTLTAVRSSVHLQKKKVKQI